jgi:hypothetical protein
MNKKLKIALRNRSSEQGFAIPIAVGMGLIMILVASTMIVRSQGDEVTASAQKATAKSLGIAEIGITRVQSFLNKNRGFANQSYPWTNYLENLANPCTSGTLYNEAAEFNNWVIIGGNDRFKVISYTPTTTDGVLLVEGQVRQGNNITSKTRLQVKIGLDRTRMPSFAPPGAWAQNFGLGNNRINGSVIDAGCPPGSLTASERSQISGNVLTDPSLTLPPPVTVPPGAISLSAITSGTTTLPTGSDTPNADGVYVYRVASSSGKSIDLRGSGEKLIIKPGQKVALYLDGNIDTQGSGVKIGHNCYDTDNPPDGEPNGATQVSGCVPTNFQIFGGTNTTSIVLGGSNTIDAFIFAPNAINSGVNGSAQIRGSVWLKEWDAANGNHTVIVQTAGWNNVPPSLWPPRLSPLSSWQRQEAL